MSSWYVSTKRKEEDTVQQIIFKARDWIELATIMTNDEFKNILWCKQGRNGTLTVGVKNGQ